MTKHPPTYSLEPGLDADEFIDVLERSGLAERRPVQERERIGAMLRNADVLVTARVDGELIGVARSLTDFSFCTYLSDLAVDRRFQGARHRPQADRRDARGRWAAHHPDPARGPRGEDVLPPRGHGAARLLLDSAAGQATQRRPRGLTGRPFTRTSK